MSRLLRDQLRIALWPDRLIVLRRARGWSSQWQLEAVWPCAAAVLEQTPAGAAATLWRPMLDTLAEHLPDIERRHGDVQLLLSNHFVRYGLLPFSAALHTTADQRGLAQIYFEQQVGAPAASWAVRVSATTYGAALFASAIDQALLDGLQTLLNHRRLRLRSLQPYLMAVFNQFHAQFHAQFQAQSLNASGNLCLAIAERGRLCLLLQQQAQPLALRSLPLPANLALLIEREILTAGLTLPAQLFLYAPDLPDLALPQLPGLTAHRLQLPASALSAFSATGQADFGLALTGLMR